MGTPDFAVPSLERLIFGSHMVAAVVTAPDKPSGRGLKLRPSPVKRCAESHSLPIIQPAQLNDPEFILALQQYNADLYVVVGFRILPPEIFTLPPKGTINLHASLLPKFRGAAPINWAIINGETTTGVTTFFIDKKVDTGTIIGQKSVSIGPDETAGELHDKLAQDGALLMEETVNLIAENRANPQQQKGEVTRAPKIDKQLCEIQWEKSAQKVHNLIRGLSPYPGAFTYLENQILKIYRASVIRPHSQNRSPGEIVNVSAKNGEIDIATGDGIVRLLEIQREGKKRMTAAEFLLGHSLMTGAVLGK